MPASCADCQDDPAQREYWSCNGECKSPRWDVLSEDEYWVCPVKLIPQNVSEWIDEYEYTKKYPATAKKYHECTDKEVDAISFYERLLDRFTALNKGR